MFPVNTNFMDLLMFFVNNSYGPFVGFNGCGVIMAVSVRLYLTAGIAMVGARASAIAPIEAPPPHIQIRASQPVVVVDDVNLTASTPTGFLNAAETILGGFESASTVLTGGRRQPDRHRPDQHQHQRARDFGFLSGKA